MRAKNHETSGILLLLLPLLPLLATPAWAIELTPLAEALQQPVGVAIQPESGHPFVFEAAEQRVVRVVDGTPQPVITGYALSPREGEQGPEFNPLSLLFLDKDRLLVGGGGLPRSTAAIRLYRIPAAGAEPLSADKAATQLQLTPPEDSAADGIGNFFALAATPASLFATCYGDASAGRLVRAELGEEGALGELRRLDLDEAWAAESTPGGLAVSPKGGHLVLLQMGSLDSEPAAELVFFNQQGELLMKLESGLMDPAALAYSPQGMLYAVDLAWSTPDKAGLYRLVGTLNDGKQGVVAKKETELARPTGMAFDPDGVLYVTELGKPATDTDELQPGRLLRIDLNAK